MFNFHSKKFQNSRQFSEYPFSGEKKLNTILYQGSNKPYILPDQGLLFTNITFSTDR